MHKDRSEREGYHFDKEKVGLAGNLTAAVWQVEYIGTIEGVLIRRKVSPGHVDAHSSEGLVRTEKQLERKTAEYRQ